MRLSVSIRETNVDTQPLAYRVNEAAKVSGTSRNTIYRCIAAGQLPCARIRGRTLILREDLEAFIRGQREVAA